MKFKIFQITLSLCHDVVGLYPHIVQRENLKAILKALDKQEGQTI